MEKEVAAALIGGFAGIIVVGLEKVAERLAKSKERTAEINSRHLNPLRLYSEEVYFRLHEISSKSRVGDRRIPALQTVENCAHVSGQDPNWFNEHGCYLISTAYFTACLFGAIKRVRGDMPYLKLRSRTDTDLLNKMFAVNHAFLGSLGVYYAVQHSIGSEMWQTERQTFLSYREFCTLVADPDHRPWFDKLIQFYLDIGRGERKENVSDAIEAIRDLSAFLDTAVRGGDSLTSRLRSEGVVHPVPDRE